MNVVFNFSTPTYAAVHEAWLKRGAAVDGFLLNPESWSFALGTNTVDSVYVSSSGTLAFGGRRRTSPEGHAMPDPSGTPFLAPLQTPLGIVPTPTATASPTASRPGSGLPIRFGATTPGRQIWWQR